MRSEMVASPAPSSSSRLAWVWRTVWSDAPLGSPKRRQTRDTVAEIEFRQQRRPVRVGEHQIEVGAVVRAKLPVELSLTQPMRLDYLRHRRRQRDLAGHLRLGFEDQPILGLAERPVHEGSVVADVAPAQGQHLAAAAAKLAPRNTGRGAGRQAGLVVGAEHWV
jgi:hypothetical protein